MLMTKRLLGVQHTISTNVGNAFQWRVWRGCSRPCPCPCRSHHPGANVCYRVSGLCSLKARTAGRWGSRVAWRGRWAGRKGRDLGLELCGASCGGWAPTGRGVGGKRPSWNQAACTNLPPFLCPTGRSFSQTQPMAACTSWGPRNNKD